MDCPSIAGEPKKPHMGRQYLHKHSCFGAHWDLVQANEQSLEIPLKDWRFLHKLHAQGQACPPFHHLCAGPLKLQREKSTYFGFSRGIVRWHKTAGACLSPSATLRRWVHLVVTLGWEILPAGDQGCPKTFSALLLGLNSDGKSAVRDFWACWIQFSSAYRWFSFWKAFKQSRYVCSRTSPPKKQSNSAGAEPDPHHPCWTTWGMGARPLRPSGVCPACGTSSGYAFQSAEYGIKLRRRQGKGAGNPRMPFLKRAYPHHSSKRPARVSSRCPEMGPRVVRPAICSNLLEC